MPEPLVRDLSEDEILRAVLPLLPPAPTTLLGPGDDAAVVAAPDGRFVVTTDVLVEDRHFRRAWSRGVDVGHRAIAQNLADVAAMGARPTSVVVSLVLPGDLELSWVVGLARGLGEASAAAGASVVGGDLSGGAQVVVAVTAHGDLEGRPPVVRSGARVGDVVAHSGQRGLSAAGLAVLQRFGHLARELRAPALAGALAAYRAPQPPLADGPAAARAGATAMLDLSDGLARDAARLARASRVVVDLDAAALRGHEKALLPAARALVRAGDDDARRPAADRAAVAALVREWVLTGGEDHGLLATFPPGTPLPGGFEAIGQVVAEADRGEGPRVLVDGASPRLAGGGWDHFGR